jgi:CcmD family protein
MENSGYLFAAFAVIWAVVFGYILVLMNRQKKLKREIEKLEADNRQDLD